MSTSSCDRTPVNPEGAARKPWTRRTCYLWQPTAGVWVLTVTHFFARKAAEDQHYYLKALASDWGRAFELTHLEADGGETYHVNLDRDNPTCDCKGFVRHDHCKHVESLVALHLRGKLDVVRPPAGAKPAAKVVHVTAVLDGQRVAVPATLDPAPKAADEYMTDDDADGPGWGLDGVVGLAPAVAEGGAA
jgi:hypothetical protein